MKTADHDRRQRTFAGWDAERKTYSHFYKSRQLVEFCGYEPQDIHEVEIREATDDEEGPYWGWQDTDDDHWSMIWPSENQFRVCFPYGLEAAVKAGKGTPVRLIVRRCKNGRDVE